MPLTYMHKRCKLPAALSTLHVGTRLSCNVWQSNIIPLHISSASPSLTRYSTKLPLGAGLILASWTYQIFMHLHSAYEPHP